MNHTFVVSTVGTSILTNGGDEKTKAMLRQTANLRADEYAEHAKQTVRSLVAKRGEELASATPQQCRPLSAELNGLLSAGATGPDFTHYLLHTDTFQGEQSAQLVKTYLDAQGCRQVQLIRIDGLTTATQDDFAKGIHHLLAWCDQTLPELTRHGGRIVFNLVGGFKGLQAYAHTIGMVYADELCYIFEASTELLRIPRLPICFDTEPMRQHASLFARLAAANDVAPRAEATGIPEAYLDIAGEHVAISPWGRLAWNSSKQEILSERLVPQPGLAYERSFESDFAKVSDGNQKAALQEVLARVAVRWQEGGLAKLRADGGLQYENMRTLPGIGHFRISQALRVSCVPDDSTLRLRHYGAHDYVNENP